MTITIDLSDDTVATLIAQARTEGRPAAELAAEVIAERFGADSDEEEFPLNADAIEKIRRGFADMDAGRTVWALEESRANLEAAFAARYGN